MNSLQLEDTSGSVLKNMDFGEVFYTPEAKIHRKYFLRNVSCDPLTLLTIQMCNFEEYQIRFKVLAIDSSLEDEEYLLPFLAEMQPSEILIPPETSVAILIIASFVFTPSERSQRMSSLSNAQIKTLLHAVCKDHTGDNYDIPFPFHAIMCTSIMAVDERKVEFDSCVVGSTYVRDVQLRNKSECVLMVRLIPQAPIDLPILFSEFETGKQLAFFETYTIEPFASKRLRISLKAKAALEAQCTIRIENLRNYTNNELLTISAFVMHKEDSEALSVELDGGLVLGSSGQIFDLGECYNGVETTKRLWIKNNSTETVETMLSSDIMNEISFSTAEHEADAKDNSMSHGYSSSFNLFQDSTSRHATDIPLPKNASSSSLRYIPENAPVEISDRKMSFSRTESQDVVPDDEDDEDKNDTYSYSYNGGKAKSTQSTDKTRKRSSTNSSRESRTIEAARAPPGRNAMADVLSTSTHEVAGDALDAEEDSYAPRRCFIGRNRVKPNGIVGPNGLVLRRNNYDIEQEIIENSAPLNAMSEQRHIKRRTVQYKPTITVILPPGAKKSVTLQYCPVEVVEPQAETLSRGTSKRQLPLPKSLNNLTAASNAAGRFATKSFKLTIQWKPSRGHDRRDSHKQRGTKVHNKFIRCRSRTCTSIISVTPTILDLGECNVGDYRTAVFTIKNESDLPALVLPYLESKSLGVTEQEISIPAKGSRHFRLEYIARMVNRDYRKSATLINVFNSHGNIGVEVRAKNVDLGQALNHSVFYKIYTRNDKRQLQVYFDQCLYNMPNLRTFSIRNLHSEPLRISLTPSDEADVSLYYLNYSSSTIAAQMRYGQRSSQDLLEFSSPRTTNKSTFIEELKWKNPVRKPGHQRPKRSSSFGDHEELLRLINEAKRPSVDLDDRPADVNQSRRNLSADLVTSPNQVSGEDFVRWMNTSGFPFSIIPQIDENERTENNAITNAVRIIQSCYIKLNAELERREFLQPLEENGEKGVITIPVGKTYDFAVVVEPKGKIERAEELEKNVLYWEIVVALLSVDSGDLEQHMKEHKHVSDPPHRHSVSPTAGAATRRPLKTRSILVRAKTMRSEMMLMQKNINFSRMTVGEISSRGVTIVNKSAVPLIYSVSKSGSISSGFLTVSTGRKGVIPSHMSRALDFVFKPALSGPFEETLRIENVLDRNNSQGIVIKAKVMKRDSFVLVPIDNGSSSDDAEKDNVWRATLLALLNSESNADAGSKPMEATNFPPVYLGTMTVGEPSTFDIRFRMKNVTTKARQFIIDASHSDAASLLLARADEGDNPFEPIIECMQSICYVRCNFKHVADNDSSAGGNKLTPDDRKVIEDKLEHFSQKLKIAIRKNKEDKIAKYQKKIDDAKAALELGANIDDAVIDELPKNGDIGDGSKAVATLPKSSLFAEEDAVAYHLTLEPEQEVVVKARVTLFPGPMYQQWASGLALPFKGYIRIFEAKNEDVIKCIRFGAMVMSSSKMTSSFSPRDSLSLRDRGLSPTREAMSPTSPGNLLDKQSRELNTPRHSSTSSILNVLPDSTPDLLHASSYDAPLDPSTMYCIVTVAQWSILETKKLYPRYRSYSSKLCNMSVKLVQVSGDLALMQGSLTVVALTGDENVVEVWLEDDPVYGDGIDLSLLSPNDHGGLSFTLRRDSKVVTGQGKVSIEGLSANAEMECLIQWRPSKTIVKPIPLVAFVGIKVRSNRGTFIKHIPVVCFFEHESSIKADKHISFGDIPETTVKTATVKITNSSATHDLHYIAMGVGVPKTMRQVANLEILSGQTGIVEPGGSAEMQLAFTATSIGKYEQEILIHNVRDIFDQKSIYVSGTVSISQLSFVTLPDLIADESGKFNRLDLGLIQLPVNIDSESAPIPEYRYPFRINNISKRLLYVTAVSNLKKQCLIYADEQCTKPATYCSLLKNKTSVLYIVLRPSISSGENRQSSKSKMRSKEEIVGRELVGGIRLVYYVSKTENQGESRSIFERSDSTTVDVSIEDSTRKLFEASLNFRAIIGRSSMKISSACTQYRCINNETSRNSSTDKLVMSGQLKGVFDLENISPTFPLKYELFDVKCRCNESSSVDLGDGAIDVCVLEKSEGTLLPLAKQRLTYQITFKSIKGLIIGSFRVRNLSTGKTHELPYSAFFDPCRLFSSVPRQLRDISHTSDVVGLRSSRVSNYSNTSLLLSEQGVVYSRGVFITGVDRLFCSGPIWTKKIAGAKASLEKIPLDDDQYVITGSSSAVLCTWQLSNPHSSSLRIAPASDLPISVIFEPVASNLIGELPLGERNKDKYKLLTSSRSKTSLQDSQRSMLTLPAGLQRLGLEKCGEAVTILPGQVMNVKVTCMAGKNCALPNFARNVEVGGSENFKGIIVFFSATQALQSFFDPFTHVARKPSTMPETRRPDMEMLPVLGFASLHGHYIVPMLRVPKQSFHLGSLKVHKRSMFLLQVENCCDGDVPFRLENVPEWMSLRWSSCTNDNDLKLPFTDLIISKGNSGMILCSKRNKVNVEVCIDIRKGTSEKYYNTTIKLKYLTSTVNTAPTESMDIRVEFEVDSTEALQLSNEFGNPLDIGGFEKHPFICCDALSIPTVNHSGNSSPEFDDVVMSTFTVRNTMLDCARAFIEVIVCDDFADSVQLEVVKMEGMTGVTQFDLLPGEVSSFRAVVKSLPGGRLDADAPKYLGYVSHQKSIDDVSNTEDEDVPDEMVEVQHYQFGSVRIKFVTVSLSSSGTWPQMSYIPNVLDQFDEVMLDVVGPIKTQPTMNCADLAGSNISVIEFPIGSIKAKNLFSLALPDTYDAKKSTQEHFYRIQDKSQQFVIENPSSADMMYRIDCHVSHRSHMQIIFEDERREHKIVNIVIPHATPSEGCIAAGGREIITLSVLPADIRNFDESTRSDVEDDIIEMTLEIHDISYPHHPPLQMPVQLRAYNILDTTHLLTREILSDDELGLDDSVLSVSDPFESKSHSTPQCDLPVLRLRGVAPSSSDLQFEVNLGQQVQREENAEWIITLENTSNRLNLPFRITAVAKEDEIWLRYDPRMGIINSEGSIPVVLYLNCSKVGYFSTYLLIDNISNQSDMQLLRVTMQVAQDYSLRSQMNAYMERLFSVQTAHNIMFQRGESNPQRSQRSESLFVDFYSLFFGKQYRRRSFLISNCTDISLEFQLSSTFDPKELSFSLSPVVPRPCSHLNLGPREQRQIFIIFKPSQYSIDATDSPISRSSSAEQVSPRSSQYTRTWSITGSVFVSCKLVKNHQETVQIRAKCSHSQLMIITDHKEHVERDPRCPANITMQLGSSNTDDTDVSHTLERDYVEANPLFLVDERWNNCRSASIRNCDTKRPAEIALYSCMRHFSLIIPEKHQSMISATWSKTAGAGGGSTMMLMIPPGGEVQVNVVVSESFIEMHDLNASTTPGSVSAEDHFMVYNNCKPSEKYRIPVRLLHRTTDEIVSSTIPLTQSNKHYKLWPNVASANAFSALEDAVVSYLKCYAMYWSASISSFAAKGYRSPQMRLDASQHGDEYSSLAISPAAPEGDRNADAHHANKKDNIDFMLSELAKLVVITDDAIIYRPLCYDGREQCEELHQAAQFADLFFHFYALTDQLVLHTIRQSAHGHRLMTSSQSEQPVSKVAILLYSVVFNHPVFGAFEASDAPVPAILVPFCKQLFYYLSYLPFDSDEIRPLRRICDMVVRCLQDSRAK